MNDSQPKEVDDSLKLAQKLKSENFPGVSFPVIHSIIRQARKGMIHAPDASELLDDVVDLKIKIGVLTEALMKYRDMGTLYRKPDDWNSFKMGGAPDFDDCEQVDVSEIASEALAEIEAKK